MAPLDMFDKASGRFRFPDKASAFLAMENALLGVPPGCREVIRDGICYYIAELAPEAAEAALVELFNELQNFDDVRMEELGFRRTIE